MEIAIRPYNKKDKADCLVAFKSSVPKYFTEDEIEDFKCFLEKLKNIETEHKNEKLHYFVVEYNKNVIGCGGFGQKDDTDVLTLIWGLISSEFHKKGCGKALLLHRLNQVKQLYPSSQLVLDTTQLSYSFFEKYGFHTTNITNDFYSKGLHRYDMTLKVIP